MDLCQHVKSLYCFGDFIKWIHATEAVDEYEFGDPEADIGCQLDDFARYMKECKNTTWHAPEVLREMRFDRMLYGEDGDTSVSGAPAAAAAPASTPTLTLEQSAPAAADPPPTATAPAEAGQQSLHTQQEKPSSIEMEQPETPETIPAPVVADADAAIAPTADVATPNSTPASTQQPDATETMPTVVATETMTTVVAIPAKAKAEPTTAAQEPGSAHDTHTPPAAPGPSTAKVASPVIAPPPAKPLQTPAKTTSSAAVEKQTSKSPASPAKAADKAKAKAKAKLCFDSM